MTVRDDPPRPFVLALVGAESSGKTHLAAALRGRLAAAGEHAVAVVDEYLREFCGERGRTPRRDEQAAIAAEQTRRIARAAAGLGAGGVVIADTTALMTAVYSDIVFGDASLYDAACRDHARGCDFTLLAAPDLPWQADGFLRTGGQVRDAIDGLTRAALRRAGAAFAVIVGSGEARTDAARAALAQARAEPSAAATDGGPAPDSAARWIHRCLRCGDAACERAALADNARPPAPGTSAAEAPPDGPAAARPAASGTTC